MEEKHIAMCGLDCGSCDAFIATKNNDSILREETARDWGARRKNKPALSAKDINCFGCLSKNKPIYKNCLKCEVRRCGFKKGIRNCKECKDYKCSKLVELQKKFF
ncbi:MAG: DUF3795 domain-containing protein [Candidatus Staskawiczbacteria bacterium]|jgi:hypothetical protein